MTNIYIQKGTNYWTIQARLAFVFYNQMENILISLFNFITFSFNIFLNFDITTQDLLHQL